jgi:formylmethanofuran dehydrogenase subunit B
MSDQPGSWAAPAHAGDRVVDRVTCLGCGCACDDVRVTVSTRGHGGRNVPTEGAVERIVQAEHACALGAAWFGDGIVPVRAAVEGADAPLEATLDAVADLLRRANQPLIYLAPDLSCESQRLGVALADQLHGVLDSVTSSTTVASVLAAQERGSATATLGEVRNRADVIVFWGVDPAVRYPRYASRYAPDPVGTWIPEGRRSRTVVAVDVGACRGPADAEVRVQVAPEDEVALLTALSAVVRGTAASSEGMGGLVWAAAHTLAPRLCAGDYVALVVDVEPLDDAGAVDAGPPSLGRASAVIALAHALNGRVRCGVSMLRAGGNRGGADAVATAHTGFPCAIDFARGHPRYLPHDGGAEARLERGDVDAVLLLGSASLVPTSTRSRLAGVPVAAIGPRASTAGLALRAFVDTGVPGIHEAGTAIRMDDVPLPLSVVLPGLALPGPASSELARSELALSGPPGHASVLRALVDRLRP